MIRVVSVLFAVMVTGVSVLMTSVGALDRGGTTVDQSLYVCGWVVFVLAVHLILSIDRSPVAWVIWFACLAAAIYGHVSFFTHSHLRAANVFAQKSAKNVGTDKQIEAVQEALSQIKARPAAEVADALYRSTDKRERSALRIELEESNKANQLRAELIRLSAVSTDAKVDGAIDPVNQKLSVILGVSETELSVVLWVGFATLLEVLGAFAWYKVLVPAGQQIRVTEGVTDCVSSLVTRVVTHVKKAMTQSVTRPITPSVTAPPTEGVTGVTSNVTESVTKLVTAPVTGAENHGVIDDDTTQVREAILSGKCRKSVAGIREYLRCGQDKARRINRELELAA